MLLCAGYTALAYLAVGLPLAVLPGWALDLGFGPMIGGLLVSAQYLATVASRLLVGPMIDRSGPRRGVVLGFLCCAGAGIATVAALRFPSPTAALAVMLAGRLLLGAGESLVSTSAMLWGIARIGAPHAARMISWNGIATYAAIAAGAPLGVVLSERGGLVLLGAALTSIGIAGCALALVQPAMRAPEAVRMPIRSVFARVFPFGAVLALATIGFGVVTAFVSLFFAAAGWPDGWMALSAFGGGFVVSRMLFAARLESRSGLRSASRFLAVEAAGLALLYLSASPGIAVAGAAITGFGFAMIFPALGVIVIEQVPPQSRGTAIGTFALFVDGALCAAGPLAGAIAACSNYALPFAAAALCALVGLWVTISLQTAGRRHEAERVTW